MILHKMRRYEVDAVAFVFSRLSLRSFAAISAISAQFDAMSRAAISKW
jgi:hypothetical protein